MVKLQPSNVHQSVKIVAHDHVKRARREISSV